MKTIATLIAGAALGAALFGALAPAVATTTADERLAREQIAALRDIANEIRAAGRECRK